MPVVQQIDNSRWPFNTLMVSREHRVMFMPIAKNANTTLKRLFVRLSGHPDRDAMLASDIHDYLTSHRTGLSLCDYSPAEAQALLDEEGYFRFAVLRNPLKRATSGYLSKFVRDRQFEGPHLESPVVIGSAIDWVYQQRNEPPDYGQSITWEEFVDHLVRNDDDGLDTHFKSQHSYLHGLKFDRLFAVENLTELAGELECRFGQPVVLERSNTTERRKRSLFRRNVLRMRPAELRALDSLPNDHELLTRSIARKLRHRFSQDMALWEQCMKSRPR